MGLHALHAASRPAILLPIVTSPAIPQLPDGATAVHSGTRLHWPADPTTRILEAKIGISVYDLVLEDLHSLPDRFLLWILKVEIPGLRVFHRHDAIVELH